MRLHFPEPVSDLEFEKIELKFGIQRYRDVFSTKNNKSLGQTIAHAKYLKLAEVVRHRYATNLDMPLGQFLLTLKKVGDDFYLKFLNKYGDGEYSQFNIADKRFLSLKGIYAYLLDGNLLYIGRCRDSMSKRINQGYGKIHPKNCYLDGQATNCHLNALITASGEAIELWLCPLSSDEGIIASEQQLIRHYRPRWNIQFSL